MHFRLLGIVVSLRLHRIVKDVVGISSACSDGKHVLFLDFDGIMKKKVVEVCVRLQRDNGLSMFYLLNSSRNHYHAVCLDKFTFGEVVDMQMGLGMRQYVKFSAMRGYWVLRISGKGEKEAPWLAGEISSIGMPSGREKSYAHWLWLNRLFGIAEVPGHDNNARLDFDMYMTEKAGGFHG